MTGTYTPPESELKRKLDKLQNVTEEIHAKELLIQAYQSDIANLKSEKGRLEWETRGLYRKGVEL